MKFKKPATPTHRDLQKLLVVALFIPFIGVAVSYHLQANEILGGLIPMYQAVLFAILLAPLAYAVRMVTKCKASRGSALAYGLVSLIASVEMLYLFVCIFSAKHDLTASFGEVSVGAASIYLLGYGAMVACTIVTLAFQYFWVYKPGKTSKRFVNSKSEAVEAS